MEIPVNSPGRKLFAVCLLALGTVMALGICGCAGLLFEGAEAGEVAGGALEAETAPAIGTAVLESPALDDLWSRGLVPTFDVPLDEDVVTPQIGQARFNIDLGSGNVSTENGVQVAQIEGSRIYRVYPRGAHELVAEVETRLARPITAYNDPTVLDRVRVLKTGDLVQVVRVDKGWYQLRYVEKDISVLLWVFAPALVSNIQRNDGSNQGSQSVSFRTQVPTHELIVSTLESTEKVKGDIDNIRPPK